MSGERREEESWCAWWSEGKGLGQREGEEKGQVKTGTGDRVERGVGRIERGKRQWQRQFGHRVEYRR